MEKRNIKIDLGAIQQTLILPLWARAKETQMENPIVYDSFAKDIISRIDYDFSDIEENKEFAENQQLQWAIRAYNFDKSIQEFLRRSENATVVNIGAGLDTTFQRIDNGKVLWANIELPDVASLRQKFIPDGERETTIAKSIFDYSWIDDITILTKNRSVIFMAAGVFFYFSADQIKNLLCKLAEVYPQAHILFDVLSSWLWIALTNWVIMRKSGMDSSVRLKWYLKNTQSLKKWLNTAKVIDEYSMFSRIPIKKNWNKKIIRDIKIGNFLRIYNMIHIQF